MCVVPVSVPAPARLPRLVELQPVGEGEALALPPAVVPPPPRVPVRAHHHLNHVVASRKNIYRCKNIYLAARPRAGDGGAEPLVGAHLVPAGRLGGARHDGVEGGAVARGLGQGALPHTARPATHRGQGIHRVSVKIIVPADRWIIK